MIRIPPFATPQDCVENRVLAVLPHEVYQRLVPHLRRVSLSFGDILHESGGHMAYVYFPASCVISLVYTMEDGFPAGIGVVGNEGVVGITLFMGDTTPPHQAIVQIAGDAARMPVKALREEFKRGGSFQLLLLRYTQAFITQISQSAVCNGLHSVEQRLCRWLLLSHDRVNSNELKLTQELISNMLGVRREHVCHTAHKLQNAGLIAYVRGHITIRDRRGLEARACECYQVVRKELDHLLSEKREKREKLA